MRSHQVCVSFSNMARSVVPSTLWWRRRLQVWDDVQVVVPLNMEHSRGRDGDHQPALDGNSLTLDTEVGLCLRVKAIKPEERCRTLQRTSRSMLPG
jgi:hypothetical protein